MADQKDKTMSSLRNVWLQDPPAKLVESNEDTDYTLVDHRLVFDNVVQLQNQKEHLSPPLSPLSFQPGDVDDSLLLLNNDDDDVCMDPGQLLLPLSSPYQPHQTLSLSPRVTTPPVEHVYVTTVEDEEDVEDASFLNNNNNRDDVASIDLTSKDLAPTLNPSTNPQPPHRLLSHQLQTFVPVRTGDGGEKDDENNMTTRSTAKGKEKDRYPVVGCSNNSSNSSYSKCRMILLIGMVYGLLVTLVFPHTTSLWHTVLHADTTVTSLSPSSSSSSLVRPAVAQEKDRGWPHVFPSVQPAWPVMGGGGDVPLDMLLLSSSSSSTTASSKDLWRLGTLFETTMMARVRHVIRSFQTTVHKVYQWTFQMMHVGFAIMILYLAYKCVAAVCSCWCWAVSSRHAITTDKRSVNRLKRNNKTKDLSSNVTIKTEEPSNWIQQQHGILAPTKSTFVSGEASMQQPSVVVTIQNYYPSCIDNIKGNIQEWQDLLQRTGRNTLPMPTYKGFDLSVYMTLTLQDLKHIAASAFGVDVSGTTKSLVIERLVCAYEEALRGVDKQDIVHLLAMVEIEVSPRMSRDRLIQKAIEVGF